MPWVVHLAPCTPLLPLNHPPVHVALAYHPPVHPTRAHPHLIASTSTRPNAHLHTASRPPHSLCVHLHRPPTHSPTSTALRQPPLTYPILSIEWQVRVQTRVHDGVGIGASYRQGFSVREISSLYRGIGPALSRGIIAGALFLGSNEYFKVVLGASDNDQFSLRECQNTITPLPCWLLVLVRCTHIHLWRLLRPCPSDTPPARST